MLTAIQGTYENGQIIWDETPPVQKRTKVIVTFLEDEPIVDGKNRKDVPSDMQGIRFGSLAGKVSTPTDFNEPIDDLNEYM
ncbi:hypothetical protein [Spirosoma sp. KNUC1025]|uniref:hypothetical protein n=1 Tax=Spirosoma sp. KNUC1025 TaxID=2894082 RepID=UPI00386D9AEE|nr:hypothetical protein LN737_02415 [Spirosoma sp. KNUC1025]